MGDLFGQLFSPWGWAAVGLLLLGLEVILPGTFVMWLGIAALLTASSTLFFDLGVEPQLLSFALYSVVSVLLGRRYFQNLFEAAPSPGLNEPAARYVGRVVEVIEPIENGRGRVKIADSPWIAQGPDTPAGRKVRIVAVDGSAVEVEPVAELPAA
ncbi:hypothetical protein B5C34_01435 [Pacificimonas flava]|uniref:NfeD-like C-terminal domain-containing protein n=2 Tax=Pacificimonas TaxID=1960290 RepID=A0A219B1M9_9SPHN|nr:MULTISPECIES: NfeD family protein [Pacificimonas]MBZ6378121.1 NfeD family protein [Pacificimonas aurantium]OWV32241.1 hypothetical protein B5C34_01435 [Pacificimonas flava]